MTARHVSAVLMSTWVAIAASISGCRADAESTAIPALESGADDDSEAGGLVSDDTGAQADAAPPPTFGASLESNGVRFRVWAPHATGVSVEGDFPESKVAMTAVDGGAFEALVAGAHAGSVYHYRLDTPSGALVRVDPWCRELAPPDCRVVDPAAYPWKSSAFARPSRNASIVYELHVGSFAVDPGASIGSFSATRARLSDLADLGVDVVELMPVHAFSSGVPNGWGYSPQLWHAPKPVLGRADELRALVDAAHGLGLAVWLDVVMNHADGSGSAPLDCFDGDCPPGGDGIYFFAPGPYARTPWGPRPDYTSADVAEMLLGSVDQWLAEYHGDGFRWDSVSNIRALDGQGTTPGGSELLVAANARAHAAGATSVAEDLKGWDGITRAVANGGLGFDAQWDGFGYDVTNQLVLADDGARDLGVIQGALSGSYAGDPFARVLFTEDHDTVGNGGARLPSRIDPGNPTSWTARRRSMLGAVLLLTAPGVPMLFMGQEFLATGTFESSPPPLAAPTTTGLAVRAFYRDMIRLRRDVDGDTGGLLDPGIEVFHRNDSAKVMAYRRFGTSNQDVIVIVNLKNQAFTEYDIGVADAGPWRVRLDTDWTRYGADFGGGSTGAITAFAGAKDGKPYTLPLRLGAYAAMVLTR